MHVEAIVIFAVSQIAKFGVKLNFRIYKTITLKHFFSFIISKSFWVNIAIMIAVVAIGIFGLSKFLDSYTRHDEFVEVPDLHGFHYTEIESFIDDKNLRYEISDSIFDADQPRGVVLDQQPLAGLSVKPHRKIYVTINSVIPPSVLLPELKDYTVRQVVNKIPTYGLIIDTIIYKPAECDNCVIGVLFEGKEIDTGTRIEKGKRISIIVGEGIGTERVSVPYLYKLTLEAAKEKLYSKGLNIGFVQFDTTVKNKMDSNLAFVWEQSPQYDSTLKIRQGQAVNLNFTVDSNKLEGIQLLELDTNMSASDSNVTNENENL